MKIYIPVCEHGKNKVEEIESKDSVYRKRPGFCSSVTYRCTIYNGDDLYSDPAGAAAYWLRDYKTEREYKISPFDPRILWKEFTTI